MADILGVTLVSVNTTEGAAYGAALLAGVGIDLWPDVASVCNEVITTTDETIPDPTMTAHYAPVYQQYQALYPILAEQFQSLAALDS